MDETPISAVMRGHAEATKSVATIYTDIVRAQQEATRTALEPMFAAMRAQSELSRAITEPLRTSWRVQSELAKAATEPLLASWRAQSELSRAITEPLRTSWRVQSELAKAVTAPMRAHSGIAKAIAEPMLLSTGTFAASMKVAELSGIALRFSELTSLARIDAGQIWESALAEAEALEADPEAMRDSIFARYDGVEYLVEREAVKEELAKVPDFDAMPTSAKFIQLVEIAVQAPSSQVQAFALGVAGNLLAVLLGPDKASAGFWLVVCLMFALVCQAGSQQRVRQTRRVLRNVPIDNQNTRIVRHACRVTDNPRPKAQRLGTLDEGAVVTITATFRGWRQVYFVNHSGQQRVGWVRSRYLRKV